MKRKIITQKQLDRLVSLGVVEKEESGYLFDGCYLFGCIMAEELLGLTVDVEKNDIDDENGRFPLMTKEEFLWRIPAFILSCNYKEMLKKADEVRK